MVVRDASRVFELTLDGAVARTLFLSAPPDRESVRSRDWSLRGFAECVVARKKGSSRLGRDEQRMADNAQRYQLQYARAVVYHHSARSLSRIGANFGKVTTLSFIEETKLYT